jgi:hypothetical protein
MATGTMFYMVGIMENNFLLLDNTRNVLALLQKGYTFIEVGASSEECSSFMIGIPHTSPPKDKETQLLSQFLITTPQVAYGVDKRYFES